MLKTNPTFDLKKAWVSYGLPIASIFDKIYHARMALRYNPIDFKVRRVDFGKIFFW